MKSEQAEQVSNAVDVVDSSLKSELAKQSEKLKVESNNSIVNTAVEIPNDNSQISNTETTVENVAISNQSEIVNPIPTTIGISIDNQPKVSALSMKSIRAKKELEAQLKPSEKHHDELPTEPFTETQMLEQWVKYANKLGEKGYKILESLILLNNPKLEGTTIIHELPNESSKIDFEGEKHDLLGYLRGKLHNHNITIEIKINESIELKKAFTTQEKYDRMKEMNPALEVLRKTFDLDL